eukprot:CAMPEP_0202960324 /NCGR_PEP_ID=MMETSP1396-20130829/4468_1 /ASSEMBLY_ACC=CAM_ASM_000872 /TAXON_ID= /ORGANISM="Pseudokeronopsis sp., Strain Brazil" /LENGTH=522 /DNA_ID=CAMNT_0049679465 /DNA_START=32 /DNA_END=1597 /DNA_ORIENTATION=-
MSKSDANDYSRFENIDDSDEEEVNTKTKTDALALLPERLLEAHRLKDAGNNFFKTNNIASAKASYEDALSKITDFQDMKGIDIIPDINLRSEVRALVVSLKSNLSMVFLKEESWSKAVTYCNQTLLLDPLHVKTILRRGSAKVRLQDYEDAKEDFKKVLEIDATNTAAKKELSDVLRLLKEHKSKSKAAFGNIFSKGSVYDDKEAERRQKEVKRIEAKMLEERAWQDDNAKRVADGLEERSLEEYRKAREAEEKESSASSEKKGEAMDNTSPSSSIPAASTTATPPSIPPKKTVAKPPNPVADEEEYDEEEAKIIAETKAKGYCYFRTPKPESLPDFAPKTISRLTSVESTVSNADSEISSVTFDPQSTATTIPSTPTNVDLVSTPSSTAAVAASSWNYAGTWEERDMSAQVKNQLSELFQNATVDVPLPSKSTASLHCQASKVEKIEGEAQIVLTRGKKRHLFDYQVETEVEITVTEPTPSDMSESSEPAENSAKKLKTFKANVTFADVSPSSTLEYTVKW